PFFIANPFHWIACRRPFSPLPSEGRGAGGVRSSTMNYSPALVPRGTRRQPGRIPRAARRMPTTELSAPARTPPPITSPQPGGGWCVRAELAWARLRRAMLRRFFPGYVARMAALLQGECPACPHDVIDSRDLKYARPVCGYWFRPEDDPFRWRDRV